MRLRSGRKTLNSSITNEAEISCISKKHRQSKSIANKVSKNKALDRLSYSKLHQSKCRESVSNCSNSFSNANSVTRNSTPNRKATVHSKPSIPLDDPSGAINSLGSCAVKNKSHEDSPMASIPNISVLSVLCEAGDQPSTSQQFPVTSTPIETEEVSRTFSSLSKENLNRRNKYTVNPTLNLTRYLADETSTKNSSVEDNRPLTVDITTWESFKKKKIPVRGNLISEGSENDQDKATKNKGQKRKHDNSLKCILSSEEKSSTGQREKDPEIISIPSDDEVVVLENDVPPVVKSNEKNSKNYLPLSEKQKCSSEVSIIDLCTPEQPPTKRKKTKSKKKNKNFFPVPPHMDHMKSSGLESVRSHLGIIKTNRLIGQNHKSSRSKRKMSKSLKKYMSILGNLQQRGPFPRASATVTSSAPVMNLPGEPSCGVGSNVYNPNPTQQIGLRPIAIDGSNVAFG